MATLKHTPLQLLGAHVRGSYVTRCDSVSLACSFDGIVESVVVDLDPKHRGEVFVAGDYHSIADCDLFEVVKPAAQADRGIASISSVRMF